MGRIVHIPCSKLLYATYTKRNTWPAHAYLEDAASLALNATFQGWGWNIGAIGIGRARKLTIKNLSLSLVSAQATSDKPVFVTDGANWFAYHEQRPTEPSIEVAIYTCAASSPFELLPFVSGVDWNESAVADAAAWAALRLQTANVDTFVDNLISRNIDGGGATHYQLDPNPFYFRGSAGTQKIASVATRGHSEYAGTFHSASPGAMLVLVPFLTPAESGVYEQEVEQLTGGAGTVATDFWYDYYRMAVAVNFDLIIESIN